MSSECIKGLDKKEANIEKLINWKKIFIKY